MIDWIVVILGIVSIGLIIWELDQDKHIKKLEGKLQKLENLTNIHIDRHERKKTNPSR